VAAINCTAALIEELFDRAAARYARTVAPILRPLTVDFVAYAAPESVDRALDLGTGTGLVVQLLTPHVRSVTGLDVAHGMLREAHTLPAPESVSYVRGDAHDLPFQARVFSLVIASLGVNATDPNRLLRAIRRVMAPGGRFVLQEWGPADPTNAVIREALNEYALDQPGGWAGRLRELSESAPPAWGDYLQDVDDYRDWLSDAGFVVEHASESAPVTLRLPVETCLAFWLAWPGRFEEVEAMDGRTRAAFWTDTTARLVALAGPDGSLVWRPVVFRVTARRHEL
jgi:ubiquinone/menaquinone biosynthesis C-methylase UbiE